MTFSALKSLFCLLILASLVAAFRSAPVSYVVKPKASPLKWTGHAEVGSWAPSGTIQLRRGSFEYDGTTLRNGRFEVDMTTLASEEPRLQAHLRDADFFDVKRFPTAEYKLREVANGYAEGQLTLKGVTRPLRFPVTVENTANGLRIQGVATVDRTEFGVRYNSASFFSNLGDQAIRNDFQLAFDVTAAPVSQ